MLRGEFRSKSGLVIPNNITTAGAQMILGSALRGDVPTFYVGLCSAVPVPGLLIENVVEPTLATNGYARLAVARDNTGWPSDGLVNGEPYLESLDLVWTAVGGPFDQPVTRMFLTPEESATVGDVYAISAALPEELAIDESTPLVDRTFNYRIYLR